MSAFQIFTQPSQQALDTAANVLSGATLTFSLTGTSTPTNAYSDSVLATPVANPLSANAAGVWIPVFLDPTISYRVVLKTAAGAVLQTWDPANENVLAYFLSILTQSLIGGILYPRTAAEIAAGVTPVDYACLPQTLPRYGGDPTGVASSQTAFNSLIAVMRKAANHTGYIPGGTYLVSSLNFADTFAMNGGAADFNNGLTLYGDGINLTTVNFAPGTVNTAGTVGIDMTGVAYFNVRDIRFNFGPTSYPQVGILIAKAFRGGVVFSGNGSFQRCLIAANGSYAVYIQGAEDLDFNDCIINGGTITTCVVISRANTAGITSPNVVGPGTLNSPANSMTAVGFSGFESVMTTSGPQCVLIDEGTLGVASFDFGQTFFQCNGATTVAIIDSGGAGSTVENLNASCIIVECNGGAGTNRALVLSAALVRNLFFHGVLASGSQIVPEFVFGNPIYGSHISWSSSVSPATIIQGTQAFGCLFQVSSNASTVNFSTVPPGSYIVMGADKTRSILDQTTVNEILNANAAIDVAGATPAVAAGRLGIGVTTSATATAGTAGAPPAQVAGYLTVNFGPVIGDLKIPLYKP